MERRASKKEIKPGYNPIKAKFEEKYRDFSEADILREQLFFQQIQMRSAKRTANDVNVIKWIFIISVVVSVVLGVMLASELA